MSRDQRSRGVVRLSLSEDGGLHETYQEGSGRLRLTRATGRREALILNMSGGLASADTFDVTVTVPAGTLAVTTPGSERAYKVLDGRPATLTQTLSASGEGTLIYAPQPTILYEASALHRRTMLDLSGHASATLCEGVVFGRAAMGEALTNVTLRESLDVSVDGVMIFADRQHLTPERWAAAATPAVLGSAGALGLVVHRGSEPQAARDALRMVMPATIRNGLVLGRILARSHEHLHSAFRDAVVALTGAPPPRAYSL
ncbi:MAG: urease accessory protein UreD [Pseudomonadota bacterium]